MTRLDTYNTDAVRSVDPAVMALAKTADVVTFGSPSAVKAGRCRLKPVQPRFKPVQPRLKSVQPRLEPVQPMLKPVQPRLEPVEPRS